jgi:hypothetical protein
MDIYPKGIIDRENALRTLEIILDERVPFAVIGIP